MSGVFILRGMGLRIPAGALTIAIGEDGRPEMNLTKVEVSLDFWDPWLAIARDRAIEAVLQYRQTLTAHREGRSEAVGELFGSTLSTAMMCMGALGFSLDALYASVKERMPDGVTADIGSETTSRHQFVHETLRRSARLSNQQAKHSRSVVQQIFRFRDAAVHPSGGWSEPVLHPELGTGMAPGYVAFSAENAARGYAATRSVIEVILANVRPQYAELAEWAGGSLQRLPEPLPPDIATEPSVDESQDDDEAGGAERALDC